MNATNTTEEKRLTVFDLVDLHYIPMLVFWGTIGNCVSIYVLLKTKLRKLSSSFYLITLLISDTVFLINQQMSWLTTMVVNIFNRHGFCQLMVYAASVSSCLSAWMVVAFTAERFVAVIYPLKSKYLCTVSRAKLTINILVVSALIIYIPQILIAGVDPGNGYCSVNKGWEHTSNVFNAIDTAIAFLGPCIIIVALNTFISRNLWKFSNIRWKLTGANQLEMMEKGNGNEKNGKKGKHNKCFYNLTKMLLIVSTVCLIMNLPSYILRIFVYLLEADLIEMSEHSLALWQHYSNILFNLNFGINFLLYCISGQNFRKSVGIVCCSCSRNHAMGSETRAQSTQSSSISSGKRKRRSRSQECDFAV